MALFPGRRPAGPPADRVLLIRDHQAQFVDVDEATSAAIKAGSLLLPRDQLREVVLRAGGRLFLAAVDLPAMVEAERLRGLEESAVLRAVFAGAEPPAAKRRDIVDWATLLMLVIVLFRVLGKHG